MKKARSGLNLFQAKDQYYVYYLPYKNEGSSNYPKGVYLPVEHTASADWLNSINSTMQPNATV
jgi:hypothetical protein